MVQNVWFLITIILLADTATELSDYELDQLNQRAQKSYCCYYLDFCILLTLLSKPMLVHFLHMNGFSFLQYSITVIVVANPDN